MIESSKVWEEIIIHVEAFVSSESKEGVFYKVNYIVVNGNTRNKTCTCPGYIHHGYCKHIKEVLEHGGHD